MVNPTPQDVILVASFWFGCLCLFIVYTTVHASLRVDEFRQDLFAIRNELFDFAAKGGIAFDHPAYVVLRSTINRFIRFAHFFSFMRALAASMLPGGIHTPSFQERLDKAMIGLPSTAREFFNGFQLRLGLACALFMISSIPGATTIIAMSSQWMNGTSGAGKRLLNSRPVRASVTLAADSEFELSMRTSG